MWSPAQQDLPRRGRQRDPFALQGYLDLVAPVQIQGNEQTLRHDNSPGTVNGGSHTINSTVHVGELERCKHRTPKAPGDESLSLRRQDGRYLRPSASSTKGPSSSPVRTAVVSGRSIGAAVGAGARPTKGSGGRGGLSGGGPGHPPPHTPRRRGRGRPPAHPPPRGAQREQ